MADDPRKQTLLDLIECFQAWKPQVRVLGNVPAGEAASALVAFIEKMDALREYYEASEAWWEHTKEVPDDVVLRFRAARARVEALDKPQEGG